MNRLEPQKKVVQSSVLGLEFIRKLRLAEYFFRTEDPDLSSVKNKSNFIPTPTPKNHNAALEKYIETLQNTPTTKSNTNVKYNVSLAERNAIKSVANDESIIIKEADKGGAVVIMDREHYKTMAETLLMDEEYYQELSADPQKSDEIKYKKFLKQIRRLFNRKRNGLLSKFWNETQLFLWLAKNS